MFFIILTSVIITIILSSLSGKSYNSFFFNVSFWRCILFLCNIFAWFLILLDVFVGVCTLDKVGTPPSLHRAASHRRRSSPVSLARDSGGLCPWPVRTVKTDKTDTNSLGIPGEVGVLDTWINSFLLQEWLKSWNFFHLLIVMSKGRIYGFY